MKLKIIAVFAIGMLLAGCPQSPAEQLQTRQSAAENNALALAKPKDVGTLSTGQKVQVAELDYATPFGTKTHYVYFVSGNTSTSDNWEEQVGKVQERRTGVMINLSPQATPEDIMKLADELKAKKDQAERAEWQRLNNKYGPK